MRNSHQTSLFDPAEIEAVEPKTGDDLAGVEWSYSRRNLFEQCLRRYYYTYYGANKRAAKDEPDKELLHRLKQMSNRFTRAGDILHLMIKTYLNKAQEGEVWTLDRLTSWARQILSKDIAYSQADPDGLNPQDSSFPPALLHELHYGWPDTLILYAEAENRLLAALNTFYYSDTFARIRATGSRAGAKVETMVRIKGLPCRVEGKIDLYYLVGDRIEIIDWKIGAPGADGDDSLQLSAYGLWANNQYGIPANKIEVFKAFLGTDELVRYSISDYEIEASQARILQDAERMALAEKYIERSGSVALTAWPQPKVCKMCPFLQVCREGKECLHA
jgi:hypothetical protein